jgi:HEAT repeat protein
MPALSRAATNDSDWSVRARALEALASATNCALPVVLHGLRDNNAQVRYAALELLVKAAPRELTNAAVLAIGAWGLLRSNPGSEWQGDAALLLRAAGQQAQGAKPDVWVPPRDGWDQVYTEATNALRQLAPRLLTNAPAPP